MANEGLNRVTLLGNIGADVELCSSNNGTAILKLRLATGERFKDRSGEYEERTEWHRCVLFGKRAEALGKILNKGDRILVEGALRTSNYDATDGTKRYTTEVVLSNVVLNGRGGQRAPAQQQEPAFGQEHDTPAPDDDDIPF